MYWKAILYTLIAWFAGLVLDVNMDVGDPKGFLCLRIIFPIIVMGLCVLKSINEIKDQEK